MIINNTDRKLFKDISIRFIEAFTSFKIKRLSTYGTDGCLVWISDNLNKNTHVNIVHHRGFLHLVSDRRIVLTIKI